MKKIFCAAVSLLLAASLAACRPLNVDPIGSEEETKYSFTVEYEKNSANTDGKTVICIDAGHGFGDVGCTSDYLGCYEYEVTIDVAKRLKTALEAKGAEVILTHDGESFPSALDVVAGAKKHNIEYIEDKIVDNDKFSAYERAVYEEFLAREYLVDFFISVHVNSVEHAEYVDGYELYYCDANPYVNLLADFAFGLEKKLDNSLKTEATVFEDSYLVTKYASIPSALIEIGYATNKADAAKMKSDAWKNELAGILADELIASVKKTSFTEY